MFIARIYARIVSGTRGSVKGGEKVNNYGREKVYHRGDEKELIRLPVGVDPEQFWAVRE